MAAVGDVRLNRAVDMAISGVLQDRDTQLHAVCQHRPHRRVAYEVLVIQLDSDAVTVSIEAVVYLCDGLLGIAGIYVGVAPEPATELPQSRQHLTVALAEALDCRGPGSAEVGHHRNVNAGRIHPGYEGTLFCPWIFSVFLRAPTVGMYVN